MFKQNQVKAFHLTESEIIKLITTGAQIPEIPDDAMIFNIYYSVTERTYCLLIAHTSFPEVEEKSLLPDESYDIII